MLFRLRRWYNQHSKTIWKVAGIVVFFLVILQTLNYFAGKNSKIEYNPNTEVSTKNEFSDLSLSTDKSVLSKEELSNNQVDSIEIINSFFAYCNEGKIKEAYNLLTDECKKEMYPQLDDFNKNYYKVVFSGQKKNISLENWAGSIYKVDISNDLLSSGGMDVSENRQDYITIKQEGDTYKLNINKYIDSIEINKSNIFDNKVEIEVEKKDMYMDYEIYTFSIKNLMDTPILLDDLKNIDSMYLEDKNNIKYSAYTHEISKSELLISARETRTIKIKYYSKYISTKKINNIMFSKVVTDYDSYIGISDTDVFNNYREFNIKI